MFLKYPVPCALLIAAHILLPRVARAEEPGPSADSASEDHVLVGAGALVYRSPFRGEGASVFPVPILSVRRGAFYADGLEGGFVLTDNSNRSFSPSLQLFVAARAIAGEVREKVTVDAGARASLSTPAGTLSLSYRHDVSGEFEGGEAIARYEATIPVGRLSITPGLQASWLDRDTANHMYGVTAEQRQAMIDDRAEVILPAFQVASSSTNLGADITVAMPLSERVVAIAYLGGAYLDRPIRDNPGLRDGFEAQALIGVGYRF